MTSLLKWLCVMAGSICVSAYADMVLIPAGSFTMGDTFGEGSANEFPLHTNYISAFYMEVTEVTQALYNEVYIWAWDHGYSFEHPGATITINHPVHTVNWYDCVKWCNARSEKDGLTPCYYTTSGQTTVHRTGDATNISNDCVNWSANGYRLPTEAEWEKAARGGSAGYRYPWTDSDTISYSRANYDGHPTYTNGVFPYTSPVGSFTVNGYGLYDMAGNVLEWCWDWYSESYYSSSPGSDPRGPSSGVYRVGRGGDWEHVASYCRTAFRGAINLPGSELYCLGLRCARSSPGTVQFSASSASVNENAGSATLTVTRTGGSSGAASVNYATANGTASAGTDYTVTSGTLNWADSNSDSKTITAPIINRSGTQGSRAFTVGLSGVSGAFLGSPTSITVTIDDASMSPPLCPNRHKRQ